MVAGACGGPDTAVDPPRELRGALHPPAGALARLLSTAGLARLRLHWDPSSTLSREPGGRYVVFRLSGERLDIRNEVTSVPYLLQTAIVSVALPFGDDPPLFEVVAEAADGRQSERWRSGLVEPLPYLSGIPLTAPDGPGLCLPLSPIRQIRPDGRGGLWVGTAGTGVAHLDTVGGTWRRWTSKDGLLDDRVTALGVDRKGAAWIGTPRGLQRLDPTAGTWRTWAATEAGARLAVDDLAVDDDDAVWFLSDGTLRCLGPGAGRPVGLEGSPAETARNVLTDGRLHPYLLRAELQQLLTRLSPAGEKLRELRHAPDGAIWLRTAAGGLLRRDPTRHRWAKIAIPPAEALAQALLWPGDAPVFAPDAGETLWVATARGLSRRRADGTWAAFALSPGRSGPRVDAIAVAEPGHVLVLTGGQPLRCADEAPRVCVPVGPAPSAVRPVWRLVARDAGGEVMWLGTEDGAFRRRTATGGALTPAVPRCEDAPPPAGLTAIAIAPNGALWIASAAGVFQRDPVTGRFRADSLGERLPSGAVSALAIDPLGNLFAANEDGVAVRVAQPLLRSSLVGRASAAPKAVVLGEDRRVWVGGPDGLRWYNLSTGEWRRVTVGEGRPDVRVGALAVTPQNEVWVGAAEGLLRWTDRAGLVAAGGALAVARPITALHLDRLMTLWFATDRNVTRFQLLLGKAVSHPLPATWVGDTVAALALVPSGALAVVTRSGRVGCIRPGGPSVVEDRRLELSSSRSADVRALAVDEGGTAWFATGELGLAAMPALCR